MSLTKRYLESLPQEEQDAILGKHEPDDEAEWDAVEINDLNDVPTVAAVEHRSISLATRLVGNYAFFPGHGWRRYVTLASATWNQYLY